MAKIYLEKLSTLLIEIDLKHEVSLPIETKHFFSGAALYVNGTICASWSPVGLAFKLPEEQVDKLINSGKAKALKYFPEGHIKKGYALFDKPDEKKSDFWTRYFVMAANHT